MKLKNMVDFSRAKLVESKLNNFRFTDIYEVELLAGLFTSEIEEDLERFDRYAEVVKIEPNKLTYKIKR